jgi:hypothetical protein
MKMVQLVTVLALSAAAVQGARVTVTPTQKVVSMLEEMKAKGVAMMESEQKTMATYSEWVDDKTTELGFSLKDAATQIEELIAFATKADSDVEVYANEIATLDSEITTLETELKEATAMRESEHAEYQKVSTDLSESVDALERAIQVLSQQNYDRPQAMMMLQKMATTDKAMPRVLAAFLQMQGQAAQPGAPEVASYEFQSGSIVSLLEKLLKKFQSQLSDTEEDESNQAHNYAMTKVHLSDTIKKSNSDREEKTVVKADTASASAKAKGELAATKADKNADEELLAEIKATHSAKSSAFAENQEVRKLELEAIGKAVEIIAGDSVSGSYADRVNLAQKAVSLLQTSSSSMAVARTQVASFLKQKGQELNSKVLLNLANQIPANAFGKVIDMIETLLQKLKEEAAEEADHKAWCDEQLKDNKMKRNRKTSESEMLMAKVEELTSTIATLGDTIKKLADEQAELTKSMIEATKFRDAEKAENAAIVADAEAGASAVENALVILKEFYSSQAAFIQQKQVPEMASYKGMQSAKGGVIGMLEVILSDFSRLKAETTAAENSAASEYSSFMSESKASKEMKHKAEVQAKLDKDETEFQKSQTNKDLEATNEELAKANEYYAQLKPSCIEVHVSYEERVAGRKAEIQALKDAYDILDQKR